MQIQFQQLVCQLFTSIMQRTARSPSLHSKWKGSDNLTSVNGSSLHLQGRVKTGWSSAWKHKPSQALSTRTWLFLNTKLFLRLVAFLQWKPNFGKTPSRVKIFRDAVFSFSCLDGQKRRFFLTMTQTQTFICVCGIISKRKLEVRLWNWVFEFIQWKNGCRLMLYLERHKCPCPGRLGLIRLIWGRLLIQPCCSTVRHDRAQGDHMRVSLRLHDS